MPGQFLRPLVGIDTSTGVQTDIDVTNRSPLVKLNGGVWDYGPWPSNAYVPFNGIIAPSSTLLATLYESNDISLYDGIVFEIYAISGTTPAVKVVPSYDGVAYSVSPIAMNNLSSPALNTAIDGTVGATVLGNYFISFPSRCKNIRMLFTASVLGGVSMRGGFFKR